MTQSRYYLSFTVILSFLIALTGCSSNSSGPGSAKDVSVTMSVQSSQAPKTITGTKAKSQPVDTLTEIKFLVEELELESAVDEDSLDFEAENLVVNLPLDGNEVQLTSSIIPQGVYDEFEMEIENEDGQNVNDPDFQDGEEEFSIVIKGVYNGTDFIYRTEEDFEQELELNPPLEINQNSSSIKVGISINPSNWFVDPSSGDPLDPNDPNNQSIIDDNISNSFDAEAESEEEDDDDDDDDDSDN